MLKAAAMAVGVPRQFVLPATYDAQLAPKQTTATGRPRSQQDEATKAWNLHTALYYKAGGFPWSLVRDPHALDTCFIGILRDAGEAFDPAAVRAAAVHLGWKPDAARGLAQIGQDVLDRKPLKTSGTMPPWDATAINRWRGGAGST